MSPDLALFVARPGHRPPRRLVPRYPVAAPVKQCEDCDQPALAGGRWCLGCLSDRAAKRRAADERHEEQLGVGDGCGTRSGYYAHRRAGEPACRSCKNANREYTRTYRAIRGAVA